jgi:putative MFS transporter
MFVFGWILNVFLVDRFGRMRLQILGFLGGAFGLLVVAAASHYGSEGLYGVAAGLTIYQISNFAGPGITSWILPVELFPTRIRATAQGVSTAVAHSGGLLAAVIVPLAIHLFGIAATILVLAGTALGGSILTKWLGVETNGITLESGTEQSLEASADEVRACLRPKRPEG